MQNIPGKRLLLRLIVFAKFEENNSRLRRVVGHCVVADILSALGTRKLDLFFKGYEKLGLFLRKGTPPGKRGTQEKQESHEQ